MGRTEGVIEAMRNIVVALDGSEPSILALGWTWELAQNWPAPVFHLVHVRQLLVSVLDTGLSTTPESIRAERERGLTLLREAATALPGAQVELHLRESLSPAQAVLDLAQDVQADLIAVGSRGAGQLMNVLLGSVSAEVLRKSTVPVLAVSNAPPRSIRKILVGVDGSPHSSRSLDIALQVGPADAEVSAVHVMHLESEDKAAYAMIDLSISGVADQTALDIVAHSVSQAGLGLERIQAVGLVGSAAEQLVSEYQIGRYDLAVVGSRGRGQLREILVGSVAERMLRLAHGPVLVAK